MNNVTFILQMEKLRPREVTWLIQGHLSSMLVFYSHCNKVQQTKRLKQQKCIFSQFWRLEVQDQGVGGVVAF